VINTADCVIVGAGVIGTSIAYELSKKGMKNIVILEQKSISSGSTGRCGGGIRAQWSTPENVKLAKKSIERFRQLEDELGDKIEYEEGGYLILAHSEKELEQFKKNVKMQKSLGLKVELITPKEAKKVVPTLNISNIVGATWSETDGSVNPFLLNYAYSNAAKKEGVKIFQREKLISSKSKKNKIMALTTDKRNISTPLVINASGGYAKEVGEILGVDIPVKPYRHEILVTEQVNRFFNNMIMSFENNIYFRQTIHGGIIGGQTNPNEKEGFNLNSGLSFLKEMSVKLSHFMPCLKNIKILRQWAGLYCMSPDAQPILGNIKDIEGYYQAVGFSGHGLMLAPRTSIIISNAIIDEDYFDEDLERLNIDRFKDGITIGEKSVV